MLRQFATGRRVHGIACFLGRSGGTGDMKVIAATGFLNQVLHDKFCHRAAADVAVADEEDVVDKGHSWAAFVSFRRICVGKGKQKS